VLGNDTNSFIVWTIAITEILGSSFGGPVFAFDSFLEDMMVPSILAKSAPNRCLGIRVDVDFLNTHDVRRDQFIQFIHARWQGAKIGRGDYQISGLDLRNRARVASFSNPAVTEGKDTGTGERRKVTQEGGGEEREGPVERIPQHERERAIRRRRRAKDVDTITTTLDVRRQR
jgi:hypothetical protein